MENGQASVHAPNFDIGWHPINESLRGKILLPVPGEQYGRVLENGELMLLFDGHRSEFGSRYWERNFPIDPETYPLVLAHDNEDLAALAAGESHTMTEWRRCSVPPPTTASAARIAGRASTSSPSLPRSGAGACPAGAG